MTKNLRILALSVTAMVVLLGCNLGNAVAPVTEIPGRTEQVLSSEIPQTPDSAPDTDSPPPPTSTNITLPTDTVAPVATVQPTSAQPTAIQPSCTVLQDLNLRTGPGTAYRPPIIALPAQTLLTPLGYNQTGIPGGSWVQVKYEAGNQIGWVSAGSQFISCNIDLTTLPSVAVAQPPKPAPPNTNNSTPDGTFPPNFVWEADYDSDYFVRFRIYDTVSGGTKDGDGIKSVSFDVLDSNGNLVYQRTENSAGYCIFGGGEPDCNPWVLEDLVYKWKSGGDAVKAGKYQLLVVVTAVSGEQGNWNYEVDIKLP